MDTKSLLFAYGTLQPGPTEPLTMSQHWPDRIKAELYDLGSYPGATLVGRAAGWIDGVVIEIDTDELPQLDSFEDVESGEFVRKLVETEQGFLCWVYEYALPVPAQAKQLQRWP